MLDNRNFWNKERRKFSETVDGCKEFLSLIETSLAEWNRTIKAEPTKCGNYVFRTN